MAQSRRSSQVESPGAEDVAPNDECLPRLAKVGKDKPFVPPPYNTWKRSTARKISTSLPLASKPFVISTADKERKRTLIASDIEYHRTNPHSVVDSFGSISHELTGIVKSTNSAHRIQSIRPLEPAQLSVSPVTLSSWNLSLVDSSSNKRPRIRRKSSYLKSVLKMISRDKRALSSLSFERMKYMLRSSDGKSLLLDDSILLEKDAMLSYYSNCFYNSNAHTSPALLNSIPASEGSGEQAMTLINPISEQPFNSQNTTSLFKWLKHLKFVADRTKAPMKPVSSSVFVEESKVNGKKTENVQKDMDEDEAGSPKKLVATQGLPVQCDDSRLSDGVAALECNSDTTFAQVNRGKASELGFGGNSKLSSNTRIVPDSSEITGTSSLSSVLPGTPITPVSSRLRASQNERTPVPLRMAPTPDIIVLTPTQPPPFPVLDPSINQSFLQNYVSENEGASLLHSIDDMDSMTNHAADFVDSVRLLSCTSLGGRQYDASVQMSMSPSALTDSIPKWDEIMSPQLSDQTPAELPPVVISLDEDLSRTRNSDDITRRQCPDALLSCSSDRTQSMRGAEDNTNFVLPLHAKMLRNQHLEASPSDSFPADENINDTSSLSVANSPVRMSETITSGDLVCHSFENNAHNSIFAAPTLLTESHGRDAPLLEDAESLNLKIQNGMNLNAVPEEKEEATERLTEESGDNPHERVIDRMYVDKSEVNAACEYETEKFEKENGKEVGISEPQKNIVKPVSKKRGIKISDAQKDDVEPASKKRHVEMEIEKRLKHGQERDSNMIELRPSVCEKIQPLSTNQVECESGHPDTPRRYLSVGNGPASCRPEVEADYNPTVVTNRSGVIDAGDGIIIYTSVGAWDEEKSMREKKTEYQKQGVEGQRPNVDYDSMQHYMISVT